MREYGAKVAIIFLSGKIKLTGVVVFFMFINFFGEFLCVICFFFCYKPKENSGVMFVSVTQDVAQCDEKIL